MKNLEFKKQLLAEFEGRLAASKALPIHIMYIYDLENYYDAQIAILKTKINQLEQKNDKLFNRRRNRQIID